MKVRKYCTGIGHGHTGKNSFVFCELVGGGDDEVTVVGGYKYKRDKAECGLVNAVPIRLQVAEPYGDEAAGHFILFFVLSVRVLTGWIL